MILIDICGSDAVIRNRQVLTCGTAGRLVRFRLDETWQTLTKTAVFRCGEVTRDVVGITDTAAIPHEVLTQPGLPLEIGLYGVSADGTLVIPTVWAVTDPVQPGADPSGDPGIEPSNPVWQQALIHMEYLDDLVGDIDTALDEILSLQETLLGGAAV